jgi:hypothetical protein
MTTTINKPQPTPTSISQRFWEAAREKVLVVQHCSNCDHHIFYPRNLCPYCWSDSLNWVTASGAAGLAAFTVIHKPGHPAFVEDTPYVVALVDLAEGPRMLTNVHAPSEQIRVGMALRLDWEDRGDFILPIFRMTNENPGGSPA